MTFSYEHSKDDHEQGVSTPKIDKIQDNFPILKISKSVIGLIKILFCSAGKVEPFILKRQIWLCCICCLVTTFSTFAVTLWTPVTVYKLLECLVNIHFMLFRIIFVVINVYFIVFKYDFFLQFIFCAFYCKSENVRNFVQGVWDSFQRLQHGRKKDYKISFIYFLVTKISKCNLKIQIKSTDCYCLRVHSHCLFWKLKEVHNL